MQVGIRVRTLPHFHGELPAYESNGASGMDVRAQLAAAISLKPYQRELIPTGLSVEIPIGYEIQVRPRSGLAFKKGLTIINSPGTVDADYRGEIKIAMINLGTETVEIQNQDRIAQLVLSPVLQISWDPADELSPTLRGSGGFGSTGR